MTTFLKERYDTSVRDELRKQFSYGNVMQIPKVEKIVLNIAKHHTKGNPAKNQKGGIIEQPMPLGLGKVMVICPHCGKPTRVAHRTDEDSKERVCKRCGEAIVVEEPK